MKKIRVRREWDIQADKLLKNKEVIKGWRIKIDEEFMVTTDGKTMWKKKGHAELALKVAFHTCIRNEITKIQEATQCDYVEAATIVDQYYQCFLKDRITIVGIKCCCNRQFQGLITV